ncbi:TetR/AcrR family transcriptional regulator [Sulfurimonas sp. HSL-3221]|uniref:TetR/AcrR family transcriptional regulator n=1 Tax=Thiomicrolovo sulfuroxydans TaxID=2894755 RepID=UPI001E51CC00|nr:TetR/AcrR family transcriptional regulator [Sulfurimonas sp. HSL-3221]UFS62812.1 TetR/AcrR family transcriptional regulator [Sulfurimonas sp. HSL-3221]
MIKAKLQDVKRSLILEAAAEAFESAGYEALKVSELAKSVGVSVGTIYGLFESKEGLYMAYVKAQIGGYIEELQVRCKTVTEPEAQLEAAFLLKFSHFASKRKAVEECAKNNPLFFSNIRHSEPEILEQVYKVIAGIVRRINPALDEAGALAMSYHLAGLSDGYINYWLVHDGDLLSQLPALQAQMLTMIKGC